MAVHHGGKVGKAAKTLAVKSSSKRFFGGAFRIIKST